MNRLFQRFQEVIESSLRTTLYKTDIYHPFDFRDSNKLYYVVKLYMQSSDEVVLSIPVEKIKTANKSYKDVHFIFSCDDGYYIWTYNKNNDILKDLVLKDDEYILNPNSLKPLP